MARYYLDSSAAAKLVLIEAESAAPSAFLRGEHELVTTRFTVLEVGRAVRRTASGEPLRARFQQLWQRFDVQELSVQMLEAAEAAGLRTWSPR